MQECGCVLRPTTGAVRHVLTSVHRQRDPTILIAQDSRDVRLEEEEGPESEGWTTHSPPGLANGSQGLDVEPHTITHTDKVGESAILGTCQTGHPDKRTKTLFSFIMSISINGKQGPCRGRGTRHTGVPFPEVRHRQSTERREGGPGRSGGQSSSAVQTKEVTE